MEETYINYKINTEYTYKVYKNEANGKAFYKLMVQKKNYDGTKINFYKQVKFAKCKPPRNEEVIRIKKGFEDLYTNSKDPHNPISVIVILEYELIDNDEVRDKQAYEKYREDLNQIDDEMLDIDDNFLD